MNTNNNNNNNRKRKEKENDASIANVTKRPATPIHFEHPMQAQLAPPPAAPRIALPPHAPIMRPQPRIIMNQRAGPPTPPDLSLTATVPHPTFIRIRRTEEVQQFVSIWRILCEKQNKHCKTNNKP